MPNNFVVFCEARTGSYSLVSRLNSLDDIVCHGEVFKKERIEVSQFHKKQLIIDTIAKRNNNPIEFISSLRRINPKKHFGFKLLNHHLNWVPKIVDHLTNDETKKVLLYRDPIQVYSSTLRTQKTGVWTLKGSSAAAGQEAAPRVEYTEETFSNFLNHYNRFIVFVRILAKMCNSFTMYYDQINDMDAISAVLNFIGSQESSSRSATAVSYTHLTLPTILLV